MTDGPPSPPRLFISRESSLTLTELQRSLSAPTGGRRGGQLWEYGQQLKQKTFETDHFRVLYAKRQLRSAPAVLLFALVSIVAFYCAFEARWTEPYRLPIRFLPWMLLSALTFGISAISTLLLARLSVTFVMSISCAIASTAIGLEYYLFSRVWRAPSMTTNVVVSTTTVIAILVLYLIYASFSSAMRVVRLGGIMLRMNKLLLIAGFAAHLLIWTALYLFAPLVRFVVPYISLPSNPRIYFYQIMSSSLWPLFYLFWLNASLEAVLSFLAAGVAARSLYEPIAQTPNWHAISQFKTLPYCLGSLLSVSLFVSALRFLSYCSQGLKYLASQSRRALERQQASYNLPMWLFVKLTIFPLVGSIAFAAHKLEPLITTLLRYVGYQVIIQIGVYGGTVSSAVKRVASKTASDHLSSTLLYFSLWMLRLIVIVSTIASVSVLQNMGVLSTILFGQELPNQILLLSVCMAITTTGDMSALLSAASEALVTVTGRDAAWLERRYNISPMITKHVDPLMIDDSDPDPQADLLEQVISLLADTDKPLDLTLLSDDENWTQDNDSDDDKPVEAESLASSDEESEVEITGIVPPPR